MAAVTQNDPSHLAATREEREQNAHSILLIPHDEMPDAEARAELVWRALRGEDVYAYTTLLSDTHTLWVRQADPAAEARFEPMTWARRWRAAGMPSVRDEANGAKEAKEV